MAFLVNELLELFKDIFFTILFTALETMGLGEVEETLGTDSTSYNFKVKVVRALYAKLVRFDDIGIKSSSVIVHCSRVGKDFAPPLPVLLSSSSSAKL